MMKPKNTLVKIMLLVVMSLLVVTTALAVGSEGQSDNSRYIGIQSLNAQLSISSSGKANCTGAVTVRNSQYRAELIMELIQLDTGDVVNTWTGSGYTSVRFTNKPWYVTRGHEYQVKVTTNIFNASNVCIETAEAVSDIIDY